MFFLAKAKKGQKPTVGATTAGFSQTDGATVDTSSKEFIRNQNEKLKSLMKQRIKG